MKTALFIIVLLVLIGTGATVLYGVGEMIVNQQDTTSYGRSNRKEHRNGCTEKGEP